MSKRENGVMGAILVVAGTLLALVPFYTRCIVRDSSGLYDTSNLSSCITSFGTYAPFFAGIIIGTIGAFMCSSSKD